MKKEHLLLKEKKQTKELISKYKGSSPVRMGSCTHTGWSD